jgi:hypothetical protein
VGIISSRSCTAIDGGRAVGPLNSIVEASFRRTDRGACSNQMNAFNGETGHDASTAWVCGRALTTVVEFARRWPGRMLALVIGLHLLWTIIRS